MSPISKAQQRATAKYMKNNYDEIKTRMPKGKKDAVSAHVQKRGESLNAFMNRAIDETMQRDEQKDGEASADSVHQRGH